jgi:hypothetical protein
MSSEADELRKAYNLKIQEIETLKDKNKEAETYIRKVEEFLKEKDMYALLGTWLICNS